MDSESTFLAERNLSVANIFQVRFLDSRNEDIGNCILKPPGRRLLTNLADSSVLDIFP